MSCYVLIAYQLLTGVSDSLTGALLFVAPEFTLRLMGLRAAPDSLVYVSYVGAFVLPVGCACLYGALLAWRRTGKDNLATVWLLTALTRASVAIFVMEKVLAGSLSTGWLSVAAFDGICAIIQAIGLHEDWLAYAVR